MPWGQGQESPYIAMETIWYTVSDQPKPRGAWHMVRRALVASLDGAGVQQSAIERFLRWKVGTRRMAGLYRTPSVEVSATGAEKPRHEDTARRDYDAAVWDAHPWVSLWSS